MSKRSKVVLTVLGSIAGLVLVVAISAPFVLQSDWFSNFVRQKIISTTEESTGGKVELGSFQFDWRHLTVRIRNFVLHGTEAKNVHPLLSVDLLELHLRLFSGIAHTIDLTYLGVQKPEVNLIVYPDGKTNIPEPKVKTKSSNTNGLQTVVDLKIGEFLLQNGLLEYAQQKSAFSGRGENLTAKLNYNSVHPSYSGSLKIDPLLLSSGTRPPLRANINLPVSIEGDAIRVAGATISTDASKINLNASLEHLNAPDIQAHVNANVSLPEVARSFDVPIDVGSRDVPKELSADLGVRMNDKNNVLQIDTAHIGLGRTTFAASGTVRDTSKPSEAAQFNASLALDELSKLFKTRSPQVDGSIALNGTASLDAQNNYRVNGVLDSHAVSIRSGSTNLNDITLHTPFHADPYLVSLDGLKLNALGGSLNAKLFIEKMQQLSVEGDLRNFSLPVLASIMTGKQLGYDGTIDGQLRATGDLKAKGTTGYNAQAKLDILPGAHGVPVRGQINARYSGPTGLVDVANSYIALPNSRLDLSGSLNKQLDLNLVSQDLNDFLPAANFGASKPETALPVTLQGGRASLQAQVEGSLSAPQITGHLAVNRFAVDQRSFDNFAIDLAASPSQADLQNGSLTRGALRTSFNGSLGLDKWSPLPSSPVSANLTLRNATLPDLLSLAGESSIPASGDITSDIHITGTYGNPLGSAVLEILNGAAYDQPFQRIYARVNLADQLISLSPLQVRSDAGALNAEGRFRHPRQSFTTGNIQLHVSSSTIQLANLTPLQQKSPGAAGAIQLNADASANLHETNGQTAFDVTNVAADVSANSLRVQNQDAGNLTATVRTVNRVVNYQVSSNFAGSDVDLRGRTNLAADYPTDASASIQHLSVAKLLSITGQSSIPASGDFSLNAHVAGTVKAPKADLNFAFANANVYEEPIDSFNGKLSYANNLVNFSSLALNTPAGNLTLNGSFQHPEADFKRGSLRLNLNTSDIQLAKVEHVKRAQLDVNGTLHMAADLAGELRDQKGVPIMLFSRLNADAEATGLQMNGQSLGQLKFNAKTSGSRLNFRLDSNLAKSDVHGQGHAELSGDYPLQADLSFSNIRYTNMAPFIPSQSGLPPAFEGLVEGKASVSGPVLDPDRLSARLELDRLSAQTNPTTSPTGAKSGRSVTIENDGPVLIALSNDVITVQQLRLKGPSTTFQVSGRANLKDQVAPLNVKLNGNVDLVVLQDADREFYSNGGLSLDAAVHGTFAKPLVNGKIVLTNANVNYATAPNGISNANGVILLNGTGATIQNLTAESGGGKISVTGFAGLTGNTFTYNLEAAANRVRVRYSGISVTSSATIDAVGNARRSLVSGNIRIQRIAYNSSSDAGSLLSSFASKPPTTPSAPSGLLTGMRLDIHILTAPDLHVSTTYANRLSVEANLTVRGTAANPGMLGRVVITDGQLVFFGNTYTVNTGTVSFYNPNTIEPVLNVSLETLAQGVDVTLGVAGTMENLNLSYRSDPPLSFEQIVELLATNTTPNNPNIVANQPPTPQQSYTQMGESAILGQAVANPLASRVQRVFGLSQFKIDPSVAGYNGQPGARVTLQQRIFNNVTFTYITDVTVANSEIVRVQWDLTPKFSAVGLRDYNGNVSIQFFYNFKIR
jgi:translocation and assembly module TamB